MILKELVGRFSKMRSPEKHSGVPLAAHPAGAERPLSIEEMIQKYIREEVSARAAEEGEGSFEDEDDFEVEDEEDVIPLTHHQVVAMTDDDLRGVAANYGIELTSEGSSGETPEEPPQGATSSSVKPGSAPLAPDADAS